MKKIAAVFDGLRFPGSTLHYAVSVAKAVQAHLVGIFLDDLSYHSFSMYQMLNEGVQNSEIMEFIARDERKRHEAARVFETACQEAGLTYSTHHDHNIALQDVLHESIYADMMIIGMNETFTREVATPPTRFIRDLLTDVQCPVMLVPPGQEDIRKIVLLYDGEPSSVYAIKMFSYLLPPWKELEVEVVSVNEANAGLHLENGRLMKEFMKRHFPKATYSVMKGPVEEKIISHLQRQPIHTLVVLGAYRRGAVSRWFRASMADMLMHTLSIPLFVAHNK